LAAKGGASMTLFVALFAATGLILARLLLGRDAARRWLVPVIGAAVVSLGVAQLAQLSARGSVANAAAAVATPSFPLSAQPQLAAAAVALSEKLRAEPGRPRVFVGGENQFFGEYATWLLREHNAAVLAPLESLPTALDGPAFLVLAGRGPWQFDVASGRLSIGERHWRGEIMHDGGMLRAYRVSPWEGSP
jgi:hypothetical protein